MTPGAAAPLDARLRQILHNGGSLFLAYLLPRLFTFAAAIAAARVLGAAEFGAYGLAAALAVILSIAATLGMQPLLVREFAQQPARAAALLRAAHAVKTVANVLMLGVLVVLAGVILGYPAAVVQACLLLGVSYAVGAYVENYAAYYQAIERMHVWTQASAAFGLVTGTLGITLIVVTGSYVLFCVAPIVGQVAALGWLRLRLPAVVRRPAPGQPPAARGLVRALLPFAGAFVALTVYSKVDVLLLAHWWPSAEVGRYAAPFKFVDITQALAAVTAGAVYPRFARAAAPGGDGVRVGSGRLMELAFVLWVPVAGVLWLVRAPVVHLLFGAEYAGGVPVLALLAPALPFLTAHLFAAYVLGAAGHMASVAALYGAGVALNVGLNLALIPPLGAVGAAAAKLGSDGALAAAALVVMHGLVGARLRFRAVAAVAGAAMFWIAAAVMAARAGPWSAALLFAAGAVLVAWRAGVVDRTERAALAGALRGMSRSLAPPSPIGRVEP